MQTDSTQRSDTGHDIPPPRTPRPHFVVNADPARWRELLDIRTTAEPDLRDLSRCICGIEGLSRIVLDSVNATSRGLSQQVSRVEHAVALLGSRGVAEIIDNCAQEHED